MYKVFNIFKKQKHSPVERGVYAFTKYRRGDFLLFINTSDDVLEFMRLPDCMQFFITKDEFKNGVTTNLFEFVESIPQEVYDVCVLNIKK